MISTVIAVLFFGLIIEASAHGGYHRGRGYAYGHYRPRPVRVWIAPPPPPIVVAPRYGYYARPHYYRGYRRHYGPRYYSYSRPVYYDRR
jgi:hypothetical protein